MGLLVASLNSGSNGNCYYIGNQQEAILVDAGISGREADKRIRRLGLDPSRLRAVFITHEHHDHIRGIRSVVKKYKIPVYITRSTLERCRLQLKEPLVRHFTPHQSIVIGNIVVTGFPKYHDACDPHSFIVSSNQVNIGVFTDIGRACKNVIHHFKQCHAAFLEANYDEEMLDKGTYSYALKNRIRGGHGHLSNRQALQLFLEHRPPFMSHLFLSHLSENNNKPEIVQNLFHPRAGNTTIVIASRYEETPVYDIFGVNGVTTRPFRSRIVKNEMQLTLF